MSTKLIQKQFLKGTREFEIVDDQIHIRIKSGFKQEEQLSVMLAVLEPEPLITRSQLEFVSRVNGETLVSLLLSRPNVNEFNAFVSTLKQRAQAEYSAFSGMNVQADPMLGNSDEEPPEFDEVSPENISKTKTINVEGVENSIQMLKTYVDNEEVQPLIAALESLRQAPQDHSKLVAVATVFDQLESSQGAVLTYAPYIGLMLSDDPFE